MGEVEVRVAHPRERRRRDALMDRYHSLGFRQFAGGGLRHVAVWRGQWLALLVWQSGAFKCRPRDQLIGLAPFGAVPAIASDWQQHAIPASAQGVSETPCLGRGGRIQSDRPYLVTIAARRAPAAPSLLAPARIRRRARARSDFHGHRPLRRSFHNQTQARIALFEFIEGGYNPRPRHSALGYLSLNDFERTAAARRPATMVHTSKPTSGLSGSVSRRPGTTLRGNPVLRSPRRLYFHRLSLNLGAGGDSPYLSTETG